MPSKYKKNLLINFNEIKKEKKLKTIKYINSDLIILIKDTQEHSYRFKHQHKNIKHKPRTKHKKTQTQI